MSATSMEQPSSSKLESRKQKSALSRGNTTQAQKSNQAAISAIVTVAAGQRLMSIPEQSFGDETASNVRTPEGHQTAVQEPPPVEPGMGPPPGRYTSMGYAQPASSPMGGKFLLFSKSFKSTMSATHTTTTTIPSTAGSSRSRPVPPPPPPLSDSAVHEEEDFEDKDEDDIIREAQARVEKVRARKAAEAARKKPEEEAARAAAEKKRKAQERAKWAQQQEEEVVERRRLLAAAATSRSQRETSPSEVSASPRRPVVEIRRTKSKGKGKHQETHPREIGQKLSTNL
ncbi:hypothetical protein EV359DRAFT_67863 [Lentinula novae-zelandiae]|nr:hypothetical protein EV359DRAFT_67863 [Lentinula novae-zelandiae]